MKTCNSLHQFLLNAARLFPDRTAVEEPGHGMLTYQELDNLSDRLRDRLSALGVGAGDRVGIYMRKSIDAVASIFGILKTGAAYVPVDPGAPAARNAYILHNCAVRVVIMEERFEAKFRDETAQLGPTPQLLFLEGTGGGMPLRQALDREEAQRPAPAMATASPAQNDLAYILYTSGSTGKPKGVMLSHENAVSFVDWCSEVFQPHENDRFSSHAPFHFDLSILDIYVPLKHGATLVLIAEDIGKEPQRLAPLIAERRISVWYSAPSILSLLAQYGNLASYDYSALRLVLFAGEVFPVKHLRALAISAAASRGISTCMVRLKRTYVPFMKFRRISRRNALRPFRSGRPVLICRRKWWTSMGARSRLNEEGELCVSGRGVMQGYWALPEQSARAFLVDDAGQRWYKTGDIVDRSGRRKLYFSWPAGSHGQEARLPG